MRTPNDVLNDCCGFEVPDGMVYMKTSDVIKAITAYHEQFTITASEREFLIARGWVDYGEPISWNEWIQTKEYKSIPPAMPSREELIEWSSKASFESTVDGNDYLVFIDGAMAMYDHLIERAKQ